MKKTFTGLLLMVSFVVFSAQTADALTSREAETLIGTLNLTGRQAAAVRALVTPTTSQAVFDAGSDVEATNAGGCYNYTRDLATGSTGADVVALQSFLVKKGFLSIPAGQAMGYYGSLTKAAVANFQAAYGLSSTGFVNVETRAFLNSHCGSNDSTSSTTTTPLITIINPYQGQTINPLKGELLTVKWITKPSSSITALDVIRLRSLSEKAGSNDLAYNVPNTGYASYKIPSNVKDGAYRVEIKTTTKGNETIIVQGEKFTIDRVANEETPSTLSSASDVTAKVSLLLTSEDRASTHERFQPGKGNGTPADDWNWKLTLTLNGEKSIKSMVIDHNASGEGWSTSRSTNNRYQKWYYPLVVAEKGEQLNYSYDHSWSSRMKAGTYYFTLYGQKENTEWQGGTLTIYFTDGTVLKTDIVGTHPTVNEDGTIDEKVSSEVSENIKCGFNNTSSAQICYTRTSTGKSYEFRGIGSLGGLVIAPKGEKLTWKSSCGGYGYTVMDGNDEYVEFKCTTEPTSTTQSDTTTTVTAAPTLAAYLADAKQDRAGVWGNFSSGKGNGNPTQYDWHLTGKLYTPSAKTIKAVTFMHSVSGEFWSTASLVNGVKPYPLVFGYSVNGQFAQQISGYDQKIDTSTGTNYIDIYMQIESGKFAGGTLLIYFTDGTSVKASVNASSITPPTTVGAVEGESSMAASYKVIGDYFKVLKEKSE
jgi:peptidoglycan hydrolase-like protein with peptidoglycan-binding domain